MVILRNIDKYDGLIVKELIKNPRISDNGISKITKIPVKTVNRKRKKLEDEGLLLYFSYLNHGPRGTKLFNSKKMYTITLKQGITRKTLLDLVNSKNTFSKFLFSYSKHFLSIQFGEKQGNIVIIFIIESFNDSDIVEIYNAEIVPNILTALGNDSIVNTEVVTISTQIRLFHNYILGINTEKGIIKKNWSDEDIFVSE